MTQYGWTVIGAGPAGIAAVGRLLDHGISGEQAKKVINFYRHPLKYAVYLDDWTLFDDTGLKGHAAAWARENIDGIPPPRLARCRVGDPEFDELRQMCDHVVYTVGFQRRHLPLTPQWGAVQYDPTNGILAPGLFGVGIAFPEYWIDPMGAGQHRVGLQKFMQRLDTALPLWLRYST